MASTIYIVGLGSGNEESLSLGVFKVLKNSEHLYLRTKVHPVVDFLIMEKVRFETFDYLYDTLTEYEMVYKKISMFLIDMAKAGQTVTYAVPGHPMVAEKSVKYLIEMGKSENIEIKIIGGESFLDTFFSRLNIDPIEGFLFLNGESITQNDLNPSKNTIIGQVYNQWIASDVKLTLMEIYPDDVPIYIVSNLGIEGTETIKQIPLFELDHDKNNFHHLSSFYLPKQEGDMAYRRQFSKLVELVQVLRAPNGCPWDKAQTHQSIRKNMIEETYELVETIDELDMEHMTEELGDVLLQVILHSQIAFEDGYFNIYDVIGQLTDKLIRRHPHVFDDKKANKEEEALAHWQDMKEKEKEQRGIRKERVLDGIPKDLPAISRAVKLQKRAANVNFDLTEIKDVYTKIDEEMNELKNASIEEQRDEMGDVLFAVINLARFLNIDPEEALARTNRKFTQRFNYIEKKLEEENVLFKNATLDLMEKYWNEAKMKLRGDNNEIR